MDPIFVIKTISNVAFIDAQNLYLGTTQSLIPWKVDLYKFREYLRKKYNVMKAFYFLGVVDENRNDLYTRIQDAGFILLFRQHTSFMVGKKKGNVDSDIIFSVMKSLYKNEIPNRIVLVAGDGDYKMLVDFLIEENRLDKILFPDQIRASSLYKKTDVSLKANLNDSDVRKKIELV
jgi:uncharacterized LabA/DUF88 family protein